MSRDELIAALEKATGPSVELDFEMWSFLDDAGIMTDAMPPYTHSRDAMIPGAEKYMLTVAGIGNAWRVTITTDFLEIGDAATEPLARRIAEIKALVKP